MIVFKRIKRALQVLFTGWCDCELWSLDSSIARNIRPRLEKFKETHEGYPNGLTMKQWDKVLDKMIQAFHLLETRDEWFNWKPEDRRLYARNQAKIDKGLSLFAKYFEALWD